MKNIDHIGIAVNDLKISIPLFEQLLQTKCYKKEMVQTEKITTAFFEIGNTKIELLQDEPDGDIISNYIQKKGEGIHHIAFEVTDIFKEIARLKAEGFTIIDEVPRKGADNKMICFLHPKSANGVLIELCEAVKP